MALPLPSAWSHCCRTFRPARYGAVSWIPSSYTSFRFRTEFRRRDHCGCWLLGGGSLRRGRSLGRFGLHHLQVRDIVSEHDAHTRAGSRDERLQKSALNELLDLATSQSREFI